MQTGIVYKMIYIKSNEKMEYGYECANCGTKILMTDNEYSVISSLNEIINSTNCKYIMFSDILDGIMKCCDYPNWFIIH